MQPKISVIIPVYNSEKYIAPCLDSILSQSYSNIEVICVDNCGTDGTRAIVDSCAAQDARVKVLSAGSNKGPGPARNIGMDAMTGEYFLFLDDDDMLAEDALLHLYETMVRTGADIVAGPARAFADEGREDLKKSVANNNRAFSLMKDCVVQFDTHTFQSLLDTCSYVVWGKLFSTAYMRRNGIRFYDGKIYHEDKGFWLKCAGSLPKLACTTKLTLLYRIRSGSIMTTNTRERKKIRKRDIRTAVRDGIDYFYKRHDKETADSLVEQVKSHRSYAPNLDPLYLGGLLRFRWYKHEKLIEFCRIQIYREKVKRDGVKEYRLFGILLRKEDNPS